MTKERFLEIFAEEGIDEEWSEITWGRISIYEKASLTDDKVREAAIGWRKYGEEGGF